MTDFERYEQLVEQKYALENRLREKYLADWKDLARRLSLEMHCYRDALEKYEDENARAALERGPKLGRGEEV